MKLEKEQLRPGGPFERSAVLGCFPLLCCFAASVLEGPKYLVTDIPIDVLSRSPRVRIGQQLSPTLGAVLIRVRRDVGALRRIRSGYSKSTRF
jgi:hypothetical protein